MGFKLSEEEYQGLKAVQKSGQDIKEIIIEALEQVLTFVECTNLEKEKEKIIVNLSKKIEDLKLTTKMKSNYIN